MFLLKSACLLFSYFTRFRKYYIIEMTLVPPMMEYVTLNKFFYTVPYLCYGAKPWVAVHVFAALPLREIKQGEAAAILARFCFIPKKNKKSISVSVLCILSLSL